MKRDEAMKVLYRASTDEQQLLEEEEGATPKKKEAVINWIE